MELTVIDLIKQTGIIVKVVLIILLFFSIFSWAIIFYKIKVYKGMKHENERFFDLFISTNNHKDLFHRLKRFELSPLASFTEGYFQKFQGKILLIRK
jgi:biopolymer transport protein TolQ